MSMNAESLRDRVAREAMLVHYKPEAVDKEQSENGPSWRDYRRIADALIAAGLVLDRASLIQESAAMGFDTAIKSLTYPDGTPVHVVSVANPYRAQS